MSRKKTIYRFVLEMDLMYLLEFNGKLSSAQPLRSFDKRGKLK